MTAPVSASSAKTFAFRSPTYTAYVPRIDATVGAVLTPPSALNDQCVQPVRRRARTRCRYRCRRRRGRRQSPGFRTPVCRPEPERPFQFQVRHIGRESSPASVESANWDESTPNPFHRRPAEATPAIAVAWRCTRRRCRPRPCRMGSPEHRFSYGAPLARAQLHRLQLPRACGHRVEDCFWCSILQRVLETVCGRLVRRSRLEQFVLVESGRVLGRRDSAACPSARSRESRRRRSNNISAVQGTRSNRCVIVRRVTAFFAARKVPSPRPSMTILPFIESLSAVPL